MFKWTPRSKLARSGGAQWRRDGRGLSNPAPAPATDFSTTESRSLNPGSSFASGPSANEGAQRTGMNPGSAPLRANPLGTGTTSPLQKL